ncbi:hypothetical protein ACQP3F_32745, partial [Escherichia coli]
MKKPWEKVSLHLPEGERLPEGKETQKGPTAESRQREYAGTCEHHRKEEEHDGTDSIPTNDRKVKH